MDFVIAFFRDVLDGPLYIVVSVICSILICSCIGYLGERYLNEKKAMAEKNATHAKISNDNEGDANAQKPAEQGQQAGDNIQSTEGAMQPSEGNVQQNSEVQQTGAAQQVENAQESSVADEKTEEVETLEEDENKEDDPNANVNYNFTVIGSDELLEDD